MGTGPLDFREAGELDRRHRVLAEFAAKLAPYSNDVAGSDVESLREVGVGDEEVFEACNVVSAFAAVNRFSIFLQVTILTARCCAAS